MKELYQRFDISVELDGAILIFRNKIENILSHGRLGAEIFESDDDENDVHWELCNILGLEYKNLFSNSGKVSHIFHALDFSEYLFRLQALLDLLWNSNEKESFTELADVIMNAINNSPVDLGLRLKFYKTKGPQILFSGSKFLDKTLVDDVLGIFEDEEKLPIKVAFDKGLKEFLESKNNVAKIRNSVRDMQLACDETVKVLFGDKHLGLRHLFKDKRWEKVGLNEYQRQIFWNLNEYIDKFVKHKSDSKITTEDAENIIYLTGMFIRLTLLKK